MKIIKKIFEVLLMILGYQDRDPLKACILYTEIGCSHVDGILCNFPNCGLLIDYIRNKKDER